MEKPKRSKKPWREATFCGFLFIIVGFISVYTRSADTPAYAPAHIMFVGGLIMALLGKLSKQVAQLQEQVNRLKSETESSPSE